MKTFLILILSCWTTVLRAQEVEPQMRLQLLDNPQAAHGWEAVGRLDIRRKGYCTGTMIHRDLVLTAAHCLFDQDGSLISTDRLLFRAGYRYKRSVAIRRITRTAILPQYKFAPDTPLSSARYDIALLSLDAPINEVNLTPFGISGVPEVGDALTVVSYARERDDAPSLQEDCVMQHNTSGLLYTDCLADFGASGSPLFADDGNGMKVVGVISAKGELAGAPVAIGPEVILPLTQLLQMLTKDAD